VPEAFTLKDLEFFMKGIGNSSLNTTNLSLSVQEISLFGKGVESLEKSIISFGRFLSCSSREGSRCELKDFCNFDGTVTDPSGGCELTQGCLKDAGSGSARDTVTNGEGLLSFHRTVGNES